MTFACWAFTFYNILHLLNLNIFRQDDGWDFDALKAESLSTLGASEVNMPLVMSTFAAANAIFLESRTIIDLMKKMMLCEETQCTKDAAAIHVRHSCLKIAERECLVAVAVSLFPYQ